METDQFGLKVHDIVLIDAMRTNVFGLLHLRVSLFISMVGEGGCGGDERKSQELFSMDTFFIDCCRLMRKILLAFMAG